MPVREPQPPRCEDYKNASKFCKAERDFFGDEAFAERYGANKKAQRARQVRVAEHASDRSPSRRFAGLGSWRVAAADGAREVGRRWQRSRAPETLGIRPFDEFAEVDEVWPRGDRLDAIREAATRFRGRFATDENRIGRCRPWTSPRPPTRPSSRSRGAAKGLNPYINIINRLVIVQFEDFDGQLRTLALGADDRRGRGGGAVLRPAAEPLRRVPLVQGVRDLLPHGRRGGRRLRAHAGGHRLRQLRPPARAGPAPDDGHDASRSTASRRRAAASSRTPSSCSSARRSTPSGRSTRCSGPGTCRAAWTA